jgi:hypothetical protein
MPMAQLRTVLAYDGERLTAGKMHDCCVFARGSGFIRDKGKLWRWSDHLPRGTRDEGSIHPPFKHPRRWLGRVFRDVSAVAIKPDFDRVRTQRSSARDRIGPTQPSQTGDANGRLFRSSAIAVRTDASMSRTSDERKRSKMGSSGRGAEL